jgi:uncharacterized repeat protein (TIGR01451 family)
MMIFRRLALTGSLLACVPLAVQALAQELDRSTFLRMIAPDLAVVQDAVPDMVAAGSNVTYKITVTNKRPAAAANVVVTAALPSSTVFVSCASTAAGVCEGTGNDRRVTLSSLAGGVSAVMTLVARVGCNVANGQVITNRATATFEGTDADTTNNAAAAAITAANTPPTIVKAAAQSASLWPPNDRMVDVTVSYQAIDACGVPSCSLGVASNKPTQAARAADKAPDWEIVDPTHVRLRAERGESGNVRTYTITITCRDSGGGTSTRPVMVTVPLEQP